MSSIGHLNNSRPYNPEAHHPERIFGELRQAGDGLVSRRRLQLAAQFLGAHIRPDSSWSLQLVLERSVVWYSKPHIIWKLSASYERWAVAHARVRRASRARSALLSSSACDLVREVPFCRVVRVRVVRVGV